MADQAMTEGRTQVARLDHAEVDAAIRRLIARHRVPSATYRLQFNADFTFGHAREIVTYLHDLGISDIYASPILTPAPGSTHGYDVCDPTQISPALGGEAGFDALVATLQEQRMGLVLDMVPNHMGITDGCNPWWLDMLESGPSSEYAAFFDVEWDPVKPELKYRVLLPILEDQYGNVLEAGKLRLEYEQGGFSIRYYENKLPIAPRTYMPILQRMLELLTQPQGPGPGRDHADDSTDSDARVELESIITAVGYLPPITETDLEKRVERAREKEVIKRRLAALCESSPVASAALEQTLTEFNGAAGDPHSFDALDELIERQVYRLAYWRVAGEEINYRRFFDINALAAIRVELPKVFQETHGLALRLLGQGKVSGFRIDHPDGLYDPVAYFGRLQERYLRSALQKELGVSDIPELAEQVSQWVRSRASVRKREGCPWPFYVVAEKILSETEPLPLDWAVCGTTGYDFLALSNGLFVSADNAQAFTRIYEHFLGESLDFDEMALSTQRLIMDTALSSEINELSHEIERIGERNRHYRDFTLNNLRDAVSEVIACLPVYRTYINSETEYITDRDRNFIVRAVRRSARRRPDIDVSVFRYIQDTLLLTNVKTFREGGREALCHWVMKFQQMTGPVMAKGVEDTAFYRYNRLVSLNEVGGHPVEFGTTVDAFHAANRRRAEHWPHSMLTTSTHDNKRSEDVRARLDVLSEMPEVWSQALAAWSEINAAARTQQEDSTFAPDRNDEYLLYQTILGTWPLVADLPGIGSSDQWGFLWSPSPGPMLDAYRDRIIAYMRKAVKEAKVHGSWINPDETYDQALRDFVARVLSPEPGNRFLETLAPLARRVAYFGQFNSLVQVLLKLTSPGLPDIYQGNELWDFSLVDPDNRRPVDYVRRQHALADIRAREQAMTGAMRNERVELAGELLANTNDGRIKLYVIYRTLNYRRTHEAYFRDATYIPLQVEGSRADHVVAFAREVGQGQVIVVVPRLMATLAGDAECPPIGSDIWQDTRLALPAAWRGVAYRNLFTDEIARGNADGPQPSLQLAAVLGRFPVAVLVPEA